MPLLPHLPPSSTRSVRHIPQLIYHLSAPEHVPYSAPVLGAILAPLAVHNARVSEYGSPDPSAYLPVVSRVPSPASGEGDKTEEINEAEVVEEGEQGAGPRPRTSPRNIHTTRKLISRWEELTSLAISAHNSTLSHRYVSLHGAWPGRNYRSNSPPDSADRIWSVGVLDTDGLRYPAWKYNLRFWSSAHKYVDSSWGGWKEVGVTLGELGWETWEGARVKGKQHRKWRNALEGFETAERHLKAVMTDLAGDGRPMSVSDLPVPLLPSLRALSTYTPSFTAENKISRSPNIMRQREHKRFYLSEDAAILKAGQAGMIVKETGVEGITSADLREIYIKSGKQEPLAYSRKTLPFASLLRDRKTGHPLAWLLVRNDLSLTAPFVPQPHPDVTPAALSALVIRTSQLLHQSLRTSLHPNSPASRLLSTIQPGGAVLSAVLPFAAAPVFSNPNSSVAASDEKSRPDPPHLAPPSDRWTTLFRALGWSESTQLEGIADLYVNFERAKWKDPEWFAQTAGIAVAEPEPEAQTTEEPKIFDAAELGLPAREMGDGVGGVMEGMKKDRKGRMDGSRMYTFNIGQKVFLSPGEGGKKEWYDWWQSLRPAAMEKGWRRRETAIETGAKTTTAMNTLIRLLCSVHAGSA